jgi:hypothetical protein
MKTEEQQDRLVDMLLSELIGGDVAPDVRTRVIEAIDCLPRRQVVLRPTVLRRAFLPPRRKSRTPVLAMAALLLLLGVVAAVLQIQHISAARTPVLTQISGSVDRSGGLIRSGESLSTGPRSGAVLLYQDGTVVELAQETTIRVAKRPLWERSKGLELMSGELEAEISPQPSGSPLVLSSSDARAEVVGTRLSFHLNDDCTRLEVNEGKVRFVPRKGGREVLVESEYFAESGKSGFRHAKIPVPGITGFTLMNAETDKPIRENPIVNGETVSLSSLPTDKINIRADFEGDPPDSVKIDIKRQHGHPTGLEPRNSREQVKPPYFVAGDHWADGRPDDCAVWTPPSGYYILSAEAIYADAEKQKLSKPITIKFWINR